MDINYDEISIFCNDIEDYALEQVRNVREKSSLSKAHIALMPDCHPGKYVPIGFTAMININDLQRLPVAVIGNDIGCGMYAIYIEKPKRGFGFDRLDNVIKEFCITHNHPDGRGVWEDEMKDFISENLVCIDHIDIERCLNSFGTLGGGNHFIEIGKSKNLMEGETDYLLTVHSGSRYLGTAIFDHYSRIAKEKSNGDTPFIDCCLYGEDLLNYINDIQVASIFAYHSRKEISTNVIMGLKTKISLNGTKKMSMDVPHNFIEQYKDTFIIRKGATARDNQVIIPIHSYDGVLKGSALDVNEDILKCWNYSLPHGSGRLMKRSDVSSNYTVSQYKKKIKEKKIHSKTVGRNTLDECPMVYRDKDQIIKQVSKVITPIAIYEPIYNYKNGKER